jgi:hypothetical protein
MSEFKSKDEEIFKNIRRQITDYYERFAFFTELEKGDKLYLDNEGIKIHKPSYFQGFSRFLSRDSRYTTLGYLESFFTDYFGFLQFVGSVCEKQTNKNIMENLIFDILGINGIIENGMITLMSTYDNEFQELRVLNEKIKNNFGIFSFNFRVRK